eukprot:8142729-Alexandrium_andersonii.AAC.1
MTVTVRCPNTLHESFVYFVSKYLAVHQFNKACAKLCNRRAERPRAECVMHDVRDTLMPAQTS